VQICCKSILYGDVLQLKLFSTENMYLQFPTLLIIFVSRFCNILYFLYLFDYVYPQWWFKKYNKKAKFSVEIQREYISHHTTTFEQYIKCWCTSNYITTWCTLNISNFYKLKIWKT